MSLNLLLQLPPFRHLYRRAQEDHASLPFSERALSALNISLDCSDQDVARVPAKGPLIVTANHPHGLLDGLVVAALVGRVRTDLRILTNRLAASIPELAELCYFVDPFGGSAAERRSRAGLRQALRWLTRGGAVAIFPSGEVAYEDVDRGTPADRAWRPTAARLAARTAAPLLPIFIEGRNSKAFYAAGRLHPLLRTALLPHELWQQRGRCVRVRIGSPIASAGLECDPGLTRRVQTACEALRPIPLPPVVPAVDPALLEADVRALPASDRLLVHGEFDVYCAAAARLPHVLREIGRLREITFREVGEGTGTTLDLDRFDSWYQHLFVWRRASREVVGAYRIGSVEDIVSQRGVSGLYTHTLFDYDEQLLRRLPPSLELGRSFVSLEYQRHSAALLLLWKGIGRVVARDGRCRVLFGPVSISRRYTDSSQRLLKAFLEQNHRNEELATLVRPRNPVRPDTRLEGQAPERVSTVHEVDRLIANLEADGKGVPVLLRQYLRLNAMLLGFNLDPEFGDVLDALMMVDLAAVDGAILSRYFGPAEVTRLQCLNGRMVAA